MKVIVCEARTRDTLDNNFLINLHYTCITLTGILKQTGEKSSPLLH